MNRLLLTLSLLFAISVNAQELSGILPKYDSYVYYDTVPLSWNAHADAIDYTVELSPMADFSSGVITSGILLATDWTSPSLNYGTWYWRVLANTPGGQVTGEIEKFTYWDPSQAQSLSFWVHAGAGLTLDGSNGVMSWQDQSSNGYVMTQDTLVERPVFNSSSLNSLPALQFNGGQFLEGGDILDIGMNNRSMHAVAQINSLASSNQALFAKSKAASAPGRYAILKVGNDLYSIYQAIINHNVIATYVPSGYSLFNAESNRQTYLNTLKVNGDLLGSETIYAAHNMNSDIRFLIGAYGSSNDSSELFHMFGDISEIVFCDVSDSANSMNIDHYLRDKYIAPLDLGEDIHSDNRLCDTVLTATAGYTNILWSTGANTPSIAVNEGTYWVEGTDFFGFVHRDTIEVHYPEIPVPSTTGICAGSSVVWNVDLGPGFTYLWSTGETTPSIAISTPGNYSVEVYDSYGCSRLSATETFYIDNYETTATLGNDTTLCIGNELYLQVGASETVSYLWPDASSNPLYGVDTTGMYWVEATNLNGCLAQDTINIVIGGTAPDAFFNTPDDCLGQTTLFTDASTPQGGDPLVSWAWNFGDGNTDNVQNTSNQYTIDGMYVVVLDVLAQSGCGDRYIDTVYVTVPPSANYSFTGHCSGDSVAFTDNSMVGDAAIVTWDWDFGQPSGMQNTSALQDPNHLYDEVNSFDVQLIVTDAYGCEDTLVQTVNLDPSPESSFIVNDGCIDASLDVTNNATIGAPGFIVSYAWDFGDGTTSNSSNPTKNYATYGTYDVQLVTTSNLACTDTVIQAVTIHALPVPNFTFSNECVGLPALFTDFSAVADGTIDSTRWIYDVLDTLYGSTSNFVFTTEGDHFVKLTTISEFGCKRDTIKIVPVGPALNAGFTTLNAGSIVVGSPVQFNNTSIGGDTYLWDLGDLTTSTDTDPTHSYAEALLDSTITVQLITNNTFGCSDTVSQSYVISRAMLDLEVQKLFLLENNGYFDVAVQLHNKGTARIEGADLELKLQNGTVMLENYPDTLYAGQTQIYVLNSHPSAVFSDQDNQEGYACLRATPYTTPMLPEEDWTNNERCQNVEGANPILIGPNPNPTDGIFEVGVLLSQDATVDLMIYDDRGRLVKELYSGAALDKGYHLNVVDLSAYGNGVYMLRLVSDDFVTTKKLVKK